MNKRVRVVQDETLDNIAILHEVVFYLLLRTCFRKVTYVYDFRIVNGIRHGVGQIGGGTSRVLARVCRRYAIGACLCSRVVQCDQMALTFLTRCQMNTQLATE